MLNSILKKVVGATVIAGGAALATAGARYATSVQHAGIGRRFVYILRSDADPECQYVGISSNVEERLQSHNQARTATHSTTGPGEWSCHWSSRTRPRPCDSNVISSPDRAVGSRSDTLRVRCPSEPNDGGLGTLTNARHAAVFVLGVRRRCERSDRPRCPRWRCCGAWSCRKMRRADASSRASMPSYAATPALDAAAHTP